MKLAATAKSLQSCPTLCNPIDSSPPGSAIPGILQTRILEWVAISFSNAWKRKVKVKSLSRVQLLATPWTAAYQTPPSIHGFSRQEYWSGVNVSYLCEMKMCFLFPWYGIWNVAQFNFINSVNSILSFLSPFNILRTCICFFLYHLFFFLQLVLLEA